MSWCNKEEAASRVEEEMDSYLFGGIWAEVEVPLYPRGYVPMTLTDTWNH